MRLLRLLVLTWTLWVPTLSNADDKTSSAAAPASQKDVARVEAELQKQRTLLAGLIQLMQRRLSAEQTALDALQAAVQSGGGVAAPAAPGATPGPEGPARVRRKRPPRVAGTGTVAGTITVRGAKAAWVYVEDLSTTTGGAATMTQKAKAFVPGVLVVPRGTRVEFPNGDPIFHNVFSSTAGAEFDLGSYPQGESRTMTVTRTGQIDVFCNLHSQMRGYVFVVPNALFTKVGADGRFSLGMVPAGKRRIGVWAPGAKAVVLEVQVTADKTAKIDMEISGGSTKAHLRKDGTPYGSYDE